MSAGGGDSARLMPSTSRGKAVSMAILMSLYFLRINVRAAAAAGAWTVNALRTRGCLVPTRMRRYDGGGYDVCSGCARAAGRAVWASERARVALSTGATADPRARCVIAWRGGMGAWRCWSRTKFVAKRAGRRRISTDGSPRSTPAAFYRAEFSWSMPISSTRHSTYMINVSL